MKFEKVARGDKKHVDNVAKEKDALLFHLCL